MYISGDNPCFSCIYHKPNKIRDIFINIEKVMYQNFLKIFRNTTWQLVKILGTKERVDCWPGDFSFFPEIENQNLREKEKILKPIISEF